MIKERLDGESRKRSAVIHDVWIRWGDHEGEKAEEHKLGRVTERAIQEELEERAIIEANILAVDNEWRPRILIIEVDSEKHVYYCDSWGQY